MKINYGVWVGKTELGPPVLGEGGGVSDYSGQI